MKCCRGILVLCTATALAGCSSSASAPGPQGTGGGAGAGSGGSQGGGTGGATAGSGGVSGTGGVLGTGGSTTSAPGSGGATGRGGQAGTGTGGASGGAAAGGRGGASPAGGTSGGGGAGEGGRDAGTGTTGSGGGGVDSGGRTGSGGTAASGGATATAGATGRGGSTGAGGSTGSQHWVGTWTASPYYASDAQPPTSLANSVLRQIAHVSLGGSQIRVQLSNLAGNGSVSISSAHVALCKATAAVDSTVDTATDKALAFSGAASVTIAQGKEVWSDPVDFAVPNQGNISITMAFASVPSQVSGHSGSRTTSYMQSGSNVSAASMTSATKTDHWFYISGIDVMADASAKAVVAVGDSITDGRGTDTNGNNRWTDVLAARLSGNAATAKVAMMNQGIGATNLVGTSGTAAQARFNRDVIGQSGVRYVIIFDGVNDIAGGASFTSMKSAYDDLISRAHAKDLLIYGATILPFGGNSYYTAAHESVRQQVNTYVKSGAFDGYIDFDAAVTDGGNPPKLQAAYAAWSQQDWLHPGPAGYQKMGETADLGLFTK